MLFVKKARGSTCFVFWNSEKNSVLGHVMAAQHDNWVKSVLQAKMINQISENLSHRCKERSKSTREKFLSMILVLDRSSVRFCVGSHKLGAITPFLLIQPLTSSAGEDVNIDFIVDVLTTLC